MGDSPLRRERPLGFGTQDLTMSDQPPPDRALPTAGFVPGTRVQGEVRVPASKSIAQRALAAAAVASGTSEILGLPGSEDVVAALRCARALGATFPSDGKADDLLATALMRRSGLGRLQGAPPRARERPRAWAKLPVGESGTSARLFTALAAFARPPGSGAEIIPSGSLAARTSPALFRALRLAGVGVEHAGRADGWPVLLTAVEPPEVLELDQPTSSQEVSALLLALASRPGERALRVTGPIPSRGYVDITCDVIASYGGSVHVDADPLSAPDREGELFKVRGPLRAPASSLTCEPDASSAAVALVAGALSGGGETWVSGVGLDSGQPDAAIVGALASFGCDTAGSSGDRLVVRGEPTRGARIDCSATPDLAPALAAVGGFVGLRGLGATELVGLETLPGKESSRIEVLARGLAQLGLTVDHDERSLRIDSGLSGRRRGGAPIVLEPHGDHRMVFCFALLSLFEPGVQTLDPGCVGKSWPGFWNDLTAAGATLSAP